MVSDGVSVQIASDLHLEFYGNRLSNVPKDIIVPHSPQTILALVGDIGLSYTDLLKEFLYQQAGRFKHVILIAGNHEYYQSHTNDKLRSVGEQKNWLRNVCMQRPNLHFLERDALELEGVVFLGTTLWSQVPDHAIDAVQKSLNDYYLSYIDPNNMAVPQTGLIFKKPRLDRRVTVLTKMRVSDTNRFFEKSFNWLVHQVEKNKDKPIVVLTHHCPSRTGTSHPSYEHPGNLIGHGFATDVLDSFIPPTSSSSPIKAWVCGHTHYNFDFVTESGIRVVSNQKGYPNRPTQESFAYQPDGVVLQISNSPPATEKIATIGTSKIVT